MDMSKDPFKSWDNALLYGKEVKVGDILFDNDENDFKTLCHITRECAVVKTGSGKIKAVSWNKLRTINEDDKSLFLDSIIYAKELETRFVW